ncbi:MAG: hypothetical protein MJ252_23835 [archaeon]|nr:hypothetical protein [archaeon]
MKGKAHFAGKTSSDIFFINGPTASVDNQYNYRNNDRYVGSIVDQMNRQRDVHERNKLARYRRNKSMECKEEQARKERIASPYYPFCKYRNRKENISFLFPDSYYNKFVNRKESGKENKKDEDNPKVTYELVGNKNSRNLIDGTGIKKSFNRNGICIYNMNSRTSGLDCATQDKISIAIKQEDASGDKFKSLKRSLEKKGIEVRPTKINHAKNSNEEIYPAKYIINKGLHKSCSAGEIKGDFRRKHP